ncbi:S49 family peptidase [Rhodoplanes elegans]|uniref:S49 family peptidase n=2 Tax=Rhodoplanes elegans TaxID=29408 RepID=A0A327JUC0_9BRAD|nr:S49 family peptidase [Rhodoplanes elegans]RAI29063.1 S49 family peptidase [Rhodoplanes elegans]
MTFGSRTEPGSGDTTGGGLRDFVAGMRRLVTPALPKRWRPDTVVVPVVRINGVIGVASPLRPGVTLAGLARALDRAFAMRGAKAVALSINSPGGAAAQSHLIFRRIRQLAEEKNLPVIAAVEDVGASGGYMIACAADEIVADPASIVGSIGVIGATFGLDKAIEKLGIERRVYTAGDNKSSLDPFLPEKPEDVARIKAIQTEIHALFIELVKSRRGDRLAGPEKTLFSGEYWTASTALGHGIVDRLGDLRSYLRERFGKDVLTPVVSPERGFLARRLMGTSLVGSAGGADFGGAHGLAEDAIAALEARAVWARYGL